MNKPDAAKSPIHNGGTMEQETQWRVEFFRSKAENGPGTWIGVGRGRESHSTRERAEAFIAAEKILDVEQKMPNFYRLLKIETTKVTNIVSQDKVPAAGR